MNRLFEQVYRKSLREEEIMADSDFDFDTDLAKKPKTTKPDTKFGDLGKGRQGLVLSMIKGKVNKLDSFLSQYGSQYLADRKGPACYIADSVIKKYWMDVKMGRNTPEEGARNLMLKYFADPSSTEFKDDDYVNPFVAMGMAGWEDEDFEEMEERGVGKAYTKVKSLINNAIESGAENIEGADGIEMAQEIMDEAEAAQQEKIIARHTKIVRGDSIKIAFEKTAEYIMAAFVYAQSLGKR